MHPCRTPAVTRPVGCLTIGYYVMGFAGTITLDESVGHFMPNEGVNVECKDATTMCVKGGFVGTDVRKKRTGPCRTPSLMGRGDFKGL